MHTTEVRIPEAEIDKIIWEMLHRPARVHTWGHATGSREGDSIHEGYDKTTHCL